MMDILTDIVTQTRRDLVIKKRQTPLKLLVAQAHTQPPVLDLAASLRGESVKLIAEVKQASPSKGIIRQHFNPVEIADIYAENGAAAISVLTEPHYFKGSLKYLSAIRQLFGARLPLLRKDFIVDSYQVYEARAYGADSILLIAAILIESKLSQLLSLSRELGMEPLVEVHNETETKIVLNAGARIIGINNRNLKDFTTDIQVTERLRPLLPPGVIVVSESGIRTRQDIYRLQKCGINAVLIGEALMGAGDIGMRIRELI